MKIKYFTSVLLLILVMTLVSAAGQGESVVAEKDLIKINVSHQPAFSHGLLFMAKEKGWIEEEGLDLNLIAFESGIPQEEAMAAGDVDISMIGSTAVVVGAQRKLVDQKVFGLAAEVTPLFTIISNNPNIKSPADLKGKSVIFTVGSSMQYFLDMALEKYDLTEKDINVLHLEPSDAQVAYLAGNGDAIVPLATQIWVITSRDPNSKIIFDGSMLAQAPGKIIETKIIDLIASTTKFADENPEAMYRFQKLWYRCVDYINDPATRVDAIKSIRDWQNKSYDAGLKYEDAEWMIDRYTFSDAKEIDQLYKKGIISGSLTREAEFYKNSGRISAIPAATEYISGQYVADFLAR